MDGRFLAVEATVYRTCKVLFIVTYAPVASDAADNEAFQLWVKQQVTAAVPDHGQRCIIWHGDHNVVANRALDEHPPPAGGGPPHRGATALNASTQALEPTSLPPRDPGGRIHVFSRLLRLKR